MADFESAFKNLMPHEGGYVNDPDDPGGETYKGIARDRHPEWQGWQIIDSHKEASSFPDNLKSDKYLASEVRMFYREQFWNRLRLDELDSQLIAEELFDAAVNQGLERVYTYFQRALNMLNRDQKDYGEIEDDGIPGPNTMDAYDAFMGTAHHYRSRTRNRNERVLLKAINGQQFERYKEIVKERPSMEKYFYGWVAHRI